VPNDESSVARTARSYRRRLTAKDLQKRREEAVGLLAWFPRLAEATEAQRQNWRLIGRGVGIHWPDVDEDISVKNLLATRGVLLTSRPPVQGIVRVPKASVEAA
jgi:Protein of unknown function (DUF2442)